jgi:hypothetical protein
MRAISVTRDSPSTRSTLVAAGYFEAVTVSFVSDLFADERLKARATLQLPGGPVQDLGEGQGVALHAFSNVADYKLADSWMRFHTFDRDLQLSFYEFTTASYGFDVVQPVRKSTTCQLPSAFCTIE